MLALVFCITGCKKEKVGKLDYARLTINNQSLQEISIRHEGVAVQPGIPIISNIGPRRIEVYNSNTNEIILDTLLNVTGNQTYYVYQPFDISVPELITELPTTPPIDPRNPLKDVTAPADGYFKLKVAFQTGFIKPGQLVDIVVMSMTEESPDVEVPVDTLHNVGPNYSVEAFLVKRHMFYGGLSDTYKFAVIDRISGATLQSSNGETLLTTPGTVLLPLENNRFVLEIGDRLAFSQFQWPKAYPIEVDGATVYYNLITRLPWSL